jgi:carbonic anhydrase
VRVPESVFGAEQIFVHRNIAKYVNAACFCCYDDSLRLASTFGVAITFSFQGLRRDLTLISLHSQFHLTDVNAFSVLFYGVAGIPYDPVTDVYVVGHSHCGGVQACHDAVNGKSGLPSDSPLWVWLGPLRVLAESYKDLPPIELAKENVRVQVRNVKEKLERLALNRPIAVKGFVYHIGVDSSSGRLEPIE